MEEIDLLPNSAELLNRFSPLSVVSGGGATSAGFSLLVTEPLDTASATKLIAVTDEVADLVKTTIEKLGNDEDGRIALVQALRRRPGVSHAGFASNGMDIQMRLDTGFGQAVGLSAESGAAAAETAPAAFAENLAPRSANPGLSVFIWDPGFFPGASKSAELLRLFQKSQRPSFSDTAYFANVDATVNALKKMGSYGSIYINTHGSLFFEQVCFATVEVPTVESVLANRDDFIKGNLFFYTSPVIGLRIGVSPGFITEHVNSFPSSIAFISACLSARNASMSEAFLSKGAAAYLGYDSFVLTGGTENTTLDLFCGMLFNGHSLQEAYSKVSSSGVGSPFTLRNNPGSEEISYPETQKPEVKITPDKKVAVIGRDFQLQADIGPQKDLTACYKPVWTNKDPAVGSISATTDHAPVTYHPMPGAAGSDTVTLKLLRPTDNSELEVEEAEAKITIDDGFTGNTWFGILREQSSNCIQSTVFGPIKVVGFSAPLGTDHYFEVDAGKVTMTRTSTSTTFPVSMTGTGGSPVKTGSGSINVTGTYETSSIQGTATLEADLSHDPAFIASTRGNATYTIQIDQANFTGMPLPCTAVFTGMIARGPPPE